MNSGPCLYVGLLASMAISWGTFIFAPQVQIGGEQPSMTVGGSTIPHPYPDNMPGMARQGEQVYRANGCQYCHTEQVRPAALGSDLLLGWGVRRSVSDDYLYENTVMLGDFRLGPDLANAGNRMDATAVLTRLYDPNLVNPGAHSVMPTYRYLFDIRPVGRIPSPQALAVTPPQEGYEVVPKESARALAAYIVSLRQDPYLFESPPPMTATNQPAGTNTPAATATTNAPVPASK